MKKLILALGVSALLFSCGSNSTENSMEDKLNEVKDEGNSKITEAKEKVESEINSVKEDVSKLADEIPTAEEMDLEIEKENKEIDDLLNDI